MLDVDGTLVDSNYQHVVTWHRALQEHGVIVPMWRVHRHIGMGGDQIVPTLAGVEFEREHGDEARATEAELYGELIGEVVPLPGAHELVRELHERDHTIVIASSGKEPQIQHYLELLEISDLVHAYTTSADVEKTKPEPDLIKAALAKIDRAPHDGDGGVLVGDSTWDCEAARRAGIEPIGVLTGGYGAEELRAAGATAIYETLEELRREIGKSALTP